MGVPVTFDATRHNIGLGVDAANLKGYQVAPGYSRQLANPVFNKASNVGTDDLIGMRSLSNWTVDDFSGGEFQEDWSDPAMFAECVGMLPDQLSRRVRTIRPLGAYQTSDGWPAGITPVSFESIGGFIFCIFNSGTPLPKVHRYNPANPASSPQKETIDNTYIAAGKLVTAAAWNRNTGRLWIGSNKPQVDTFDYNSAAASGSRLVHNASYSAPSASTVVTGIHIFGAMKLIVTENNAAGISILDDDSDVWLYVSGGSPNTKWDHVGNLPGSFVKSITFNNAVYILSRSGNNQTYLSMTQGSQVFPVVELPYFFRGWNMVEYAGRIYIGGVGNDLDGNDKHGELYEVSGASLRLVRTFASFNNDPTPATAAAKMATTSPGTAPVKRKRVMSKLRGMCVCEGLLWMPDSSYSGLEAYDATTDSFFGAARNRHGDDTNVSFTALLPFADSLYIWSAGGTANTTGLYRTERKADTGEGYVSYLITSTFQPEPARDKAWSRFTAITQGPVSPVLYYSKDNGDSWTSVGAGVSTVNGNRRETVYDLSAVVPSRGIRFKLEWPMTGASDEACCYLIAHSLSFLIRGDTKRRWQFTILGADDVEDEQGDDLVQVPVDVATTLWTLKDTAAPITLRDPDGTDYKVFITDISDQHPAITATGERFVNVTLVEV